MVANLREIRKRAGLTQKQLANKLQTSQQNVTRWETGKAEPNLATLRDLAIILRSSVDQLMGRATIFDHQTTDPLAWIEGDNSGYWGNIGLRMAGKTASTWYPITTATMSQLHHDLQTVSSEGWLLFQTLNNKMVAFRPTHCVMATFLDEADDQVEGDWKVGPSDVEGWPREVYECLSDIPYCSDNELSASFSPALLETARSLVDKHSLDDEAIYRMVSKTRVTFSDGAERSFRITPEALETIFFTLENWELEDGTMLHFDDHDGCRPVFLSTQFLSRIELPLLLLEEGARSALRDIDRLED